MPENHNHYDRHRGPRDRRLRAGDSDRDAVADILREQHLAGRLDSDEFQERLDRCMAAKTYAHLDELITDLPGDSGETRAMSRPWRWRPWPFAILPLTIIAAIALSGGHLLWLAIPLIFLFVVRPFLWRSWGRGYGWGVWGAACATPLDAAHVHERSCNRVLLVTGADPSLRGVGRENARAEHHPLGSRPGSRSSRD